MLNVDHISVYLLALAAVLLLLFLALQTVVFTGSLVSVVWMIGAALAIGTFCWVYANGRLD
jgi:hypothetical protein